jgi:hypothetical protein
MSGGDIGGDDSVEWRIFVDNVRRSTIRNCSIGETGYEQGGVDETDEGEQFTISLKMPQDPGDFVRTLQAAAAAAQKYAGTPGYLVSFVLPIEKRSYDQIQIRWNSTKAPGKPPKGKASTRSLKKKGSKRTAGKTVKSAPASGRRR